MHCFSYYYVDFENDVVAIDAPSVTGNGGGFRMDNAKNCLFRRNCKDNSLKRVKHAIFRYASWAWKEEIEIDDVPGIEKLRKDVVKNCLLWLEGLDSLIVDGSSNRLRCASDESFGEHHGEKTREIILETIEKIREKARMKNSVFDCSWVCPRVEWVDIKDALQK